MKNTMPQQLNHAKAMLPRVFSLHGADGGTRAIFCSHDQNRVEDKLRFWAGFLAIGWVAIEWRDGVPVQTYGRARG